MPSDGINLVIVGASVRAAAFSALRAGLRPWCVDRFADADLRARCPARPLTGTYPDNFAEQLGGAPPGPWMYTGGLENHPGLVRRIARERPLWGNDAPALAACRDPERVARVLRDAGLPGPRVGRPGAPAPAEGRWLLKPRRGAGGAGIHFFGGEVSKAVRARSYVQEYVEGEPRAALFVADGRTTRLLGVTRMLVGEPWLHAAPFHYCGSVGPLELGQDESAVLERLGMALAVGCGLRGLFGVDGVWRDGVFWPVEVNPRYPASAEVLEYATGLAALAWHRRAFDPAAQEPPGPPPAPSVLGKAILFAPTAVTVPDDGPWRDVLRNPPPPGEVPRFADIPDAGQRVEARRPVLTCFARGTDVAPCLDALRRTAVEVEARLIREEDPLADSHE